MLSASSPDNRRNNGQFDSPKEWRRLTSINDVYCSISIACGLLFVGFAVLGAILPLLPTTPFLIVASGCFARSSPRLHRWLRSIPLFGRMLTDWEQHRSVPIRTKMSASALIGAAIILTTAFGRLSAFGLLLLYLLTAAGLLVIWSLPSNDRRRSN